MQKVRGLVCFEYRTFENVLEAFRGFDLDETEFGYFKSLFRYGKIITNPGVLIRGLVDDSYASADIVNILRKRIDLGPELRNCDISIGSEDDLKEVKHGDLEGEHVGIRINPPLSGEHTGIRINPPYGFRDVVSLSSEIGDMTNAHDIFVRTAESPVNAPGNPLVCIDLMTSAKFRDYKNRVEHVISSEGFSQAMDKYTMFSLICARNKP